MSEHNHWRSFPFLKALRPEPGEVVDSAVLTTYSADLVVVAASLLALAGLDDERGSGSKIDFTDSFERLNGRFRVICQRGRIVEPFRNLLTLNLMDRFVREVGVDDNSSWHAKTAFIRYLRDDGSYGWRIWLGSRNLTQSMAWEFGFLLVSSKSEGQAIAGIGGVARALAAAARLENFTENSVGQELDRLKWRTPRGVVVEDLHFWQVGTKRSLPDPPSKIRRLVLVSPFLDGAIVSRFGKWGDDNTERIIVSTLPELKKLSMQSQVPLAGFGDNLRYLDSPVENEPEDDPGATNTSSDEEEEARGLHAKLLFVEHANGRSLWVGSSNATQRGWLGPNSEIIVRLSVDSDIANGLTLFIDSQTCDVCDDLLNIAEPPDPNEELINVVRNKLAATWNLRQELENNIYFLCGDYAPQDVTGEVEISAGRLGGTLQQWTPGALRLPLAATTDAGLTEFVVISLRLGESCCKWIQLAPIRGFDREQRDKLLIAQYLDVRTFLSWIRNLLDDSAAGDGGGDWKDEKRRRGRHSHNRNDISLWAPTLEQALKAWVRDPQQLKRADSALTRYFDSVRDAQEQPLTPEELRAVEAVKVVWPVIRRELIHARSGSKVVK